MSFKPWKQPLLAALALMAGTTAATAQNVQKAQRAIEVGRYDEARALLRSQDSPELTYEMGRLYLMRDMPDSAAFYFNKVGTTTPMGMVAAGRALLTKGQVAAAEAQFDAATKATKNKDAKVLTMIAQAYAEADTKDMGKAQSYIATAQALNKKDEPELMVARGDVFLHSEKGGGDAMSSFDRAITANPSYVQAYYKKGVLSVRSRNFNAAREALNKAIDLDPSYAPAYRELADMYYLAGQYDLALKSIQKYMELAEKSPATDAQYAAFLYKSKKYPDALVAVNKVLEADPSNLTMNRLRPYLLYETNDFAEAATAMDTYMKVAPAGKIIPEDYAYQAKILSKTGKGPEAIAIISKIIKEDPTKACDFQNDLASIYANQKNYKGAISVYKYKLNKCNGDLVDQFRLASAFSSDKQYVEADSVYGIINTAKPTYAPAYLYRAQTNMLKDPEAKEGLAKPYYDKYIELSKEAGAEPDKFKQGLVEAYGYLGVYNFQKGDKPGALSYFQQVLTLDPENKGAKNNIEVLTAKPKTATKTRTTTTKKSTGKK